MNIVFMGTPSFAVPSLERLQQDGHNIREVVTAPDKPRGRGRKSVPTSVGEAAVRLDLPVSAPENLRDGRFLGHLRSLSPDIIVVVAFRILPEEIFDIPTAGIFNLHASLLPRYRGAAPIPWAILRGETETGVTTFLLEKRVDTGRILFQEKLAIGPDETGGELHDRLAVLGSEVVSRTVSSIADGSARPREQDHTAATTAPKISQEDCQIEWSGLSIEIHNRIRAFSPVPGAWTLLNSRKLKVFRSRRIPGAELTRGRPGSVTSSGEGRCIVECGEGGVALEEVMLEGRKRMRIEEFLRGFDLKQGTVLG